MENDNVLQNENGAQGVQMQQQTHQMQQPVDMGINGPNAVMAPKKKSKKWLWWVLALVTVIAIVAVVLVLTLGKIGGVTMEKVKAYCNNHNLEVSEGVLEEEPKGNYIQCSTEEDQLVGASTEYMMVMFAEYDKPVAENENFAESYEFMKSVGVVLDESDEYKKLYLGNTDTGVGGISGVSYLIISDKTSMSLIAFNNDIARKALVEMGYPDRNWGTDEEQQATTSDLQVAQRNTQRRDDMASLAAALTQYQANNRGQLPSGPVYWQGEAYLGCADANVACEFVQNYLNQADNRETNEFTNPIGEPYSLYITGNWINDGDIDLVYAGENMGLVASGDGYMIAEGKDRQDTVYVVVGGQCDSDSDIVIKGTNPRRYAVMLKLEADGGTYCIDS